MKWQAILCLVDIGVLFFSLCFERVPPDIATLFALLVLWCAGVIGTTDALGGFGNSALITVAALFVVVEAAQKVSWIAKLSKRAFGRSKYGQLSMLKQMALIGTLSAFLNNTPLVAFFTPIVKDWARSNGFPASKFLMSVSFSAIMGGMITIIGTSTTLVVQGLLVGSKLPQMSFFEPAYVALPVCAVGFIFMATVGYWLLPSNRGGLFRHAKEHASEFLTEMVIEDGSSLVGRRVTDVLLQLFRGQATPIKLLRPRVEGSAEASVSVGEAAGSGNSAAVADAGDVQLTQVPLVAPMEKPRARSRSRGNSDARKRSASGQTSPAAAAAHGDAGDDAGVAPRETSAELRASLTGNAETDAKDEEIVELAPTNDELAAVRQAAREEAEAYTTLAPIGNEDTFKAGDRLILAVDHEAMLEAHHERSGARFVDLEIHDVRGLMHQSYEVVLSASNPFVGRPASSALRELSKKYECVVLALRRNGVTETAGNENSLKSALLAAGDTLLLVGKESFKADWLPSREFFVISSIGEPRPPMKWWQYGTVLILIAMFVVGGGGFLAMEQVAMVAAVLNVVCGFVTPKEAYQAIQWDLVVLIGSSLGIGKAMEVSGLAKDIATALASLNMPPTALIYILYLVVLAMTEIISNNSAAALSYPIAISVAKALKINHMPFVMVIVFAATCAFAIPLGYQCHLMVMGPGGYTMRDFLKVGIILDLLIAVTVAGLVPYIWSF